MKTKHLISFMSLVLLLFILAISVIYTILTTDAVPTMENISDKSISTSVLEYPINENGESYGPDFKDQSMEPPDLQLAVNEEGIVGYIRTSEIPGGKISSPEEAAEYTPHNGYINLYEKDGKTVIGKFFIG